MKSALKILLCFWTVMASAQVDPVIIKVNHDSTVFPDFIDKIEKEQNVRFFYHKPWLDTMLVIQKQVPARLEHILDDSFKETGFDYLFDGPHVLITKQYKLTTAIPEGFFVGDNNAENISDTMDLEYAFIEQTTKQEGNGNGGRINIGDPANRFMGEKAVISGIVRNKEDGEPIIGATVQVEDTEKGTVTDLYGYYVLTVPKGKNEIIYKYVGRKDTRVPVVVNEDGELDVELEKSLVQLGEVVISAGKEDNVRNMNMGMQRMDIQEVKQIPTSMGEADIIKTALLLPGVQTVGEGASGFNVRGGSADQNLILFDGAPIFNSSHLFGFFSVFNSEVIKDFELYKSGIPARYGGRVSSVFDVTAKQGNRKKYILSGGISPITGKLTIEGPIIKEKASFMIGGRKTYSQWLLHQIDKPELKNSSADFYDINAKVSYDINDNNSVSIMGYQSKDFFNLNSDSTYHYENQSASIFFKHSFTKKIYGTARVVHSNYRYNITSDENPSSAFDLSYNIDYKALKTEFFYFPNSTHNLNFGAEIKNYGVAPGNFTPLSAESDISEQSLSKEHGIESGLFINDEFTINDKLTISGGLRLSMFTVLGPGKVYTYRKDAPKSVDSRIDSTHYSDNEIIKNYGGPEMRFSARYKTGSSNSVKFSYNRMHQFLHMLTNSTAISPTDVWKTSDAHIKPLIGDQVSLGFYQNLFTNTVESSVEVYYKRTKNQLDYKSGTELVLNPDLEVDLLSGTGRAYGVELLFKKKFGRLNGWVSYTYSRSELKIDGQFTNEIINNGEYYPANYDKPHDLTLVGNYKFSRRLSLSNNFTYSTGRPVSFPVAKYDFRGRELIHYSERNEYRIPDYIRWDISVNIEGNLKSQKLAHSSLSIGIYNVLGRDNVYSIFFKTTKSGVKGYQLSVFAQPILNVTYNFRF